jgi:hypothetical protein
MNLILENLVQRALNGLEDILLKFQSQINCDGFYKNKELSKIWEDDLPGDSILETPDFKGKCPGDFAENNSKFQEDQYEDSYEEFLSCLEDVFPSPPGPRKFVQDTIKGVGIQRKKQLHRSPLELQGEVHPLPDISMDKFPILFRNISDDAKNFFIKFDSAYEIFNVAGNDVACQLFILNLKEDVSEWFYSFLPDNITTWDALENIFVEKYVPRKYP